MEAQKLACTPEDVEIFKLQKEIKYTSQLYKLNGKNPLILF